MKSKIITIFWAVVFFLFGIGLLVGTIDLKQLSQEAWMISLAVVSIAFTLTYILDGIKKYSLLLPAFACAAIAVEIGLELNGVAILVGLALWFIVGFLIERKNWWLLIPAYILAFAAIETIVNSIITPSILIQGQMSKFLLVFSSGAGVMFMLALPFFVVYFWSKKSWWAFIPAGGLTTLGLVVGLEALISNEHSVHTGLFGAILFLGSAITLAILWLRRKTQPTQWAIYPAAGLLVLAILAFILGNGWNSLSDQTKTIGFAIASVIFFIAYLVNGLRKWGWLFPALICATMAIVSWMSLNNMEDTSLKGLPIFLSIAVPFYVGFSLDTRRWGLLIPAISATIVMILILISDTNFEGIGVMFTFALPFFVIYFLSKKNWWAFIPAGVFASIGLVSLLEELVPHQEYPRLANTISWDVLTWVMFLGLSVTFAIPWVRRKTQPTAWTMYPALGFLALSILSFVLGERFQEFWLASMMLIIACMLLLVTLTTKVSRQGQQTTELKA